MSSPSKTQVLVVGAGPCGLTLAVALALRGVDAVIVDDREHMQGTSRAPVIHSATLEFLDTIGCAAPMIARGQKVEHVTIRSPRRVLFRVDFNGMEKITKFPFALVLPQQDTEDVLVSRLGELGKRVWRPRKVVELFENTEKGMREVVFDNGERIFAEYVVGADGVRSAVRNLARIPFLTLPQHLSGTLPSPSDGLETPTLDSSAGQLSLIDIRLTPSTVPPSLRSGVTLFFSQYVMGWVALQDGSFRLVCSVPVGEEVPKDPSVGFVQRMIDQRGLQGAGVKVESVIWGSRFRVRSRIAKRFFLPAEELELPTASSSTDKLPMPSTAPGSPSPTATPLPPKPSTSKGGGIVLAGDAAHVHSPAGGQGLNLSVRDSIVLASALQSVLSPSSNNSYLPLLEYERERQEIAAQIITMSDWMMWGALRTGLAARIRDVLAWCLGRMPFFGRMVALKLSGMKIETRFAWEILGLEGADVI